MSKRKKQRRPQTPQTAIKKAQLKAQLAAIDTIWAIFFTVMREKEGYGIKRLARLWDRVNELSEKISKGETSVDDLIKNLREAGITLGGGENEGGTRQKRHFKALSKRAKAGEQQV